MIIKYKFLMMLAIIGSLLATLEEAGIPKTLPMPDKPMAGVFAGCRSTLDVNWKNFSRFEWCVAYFVANPKEALNNTNFVKKSSEWMAFLQQSIIAQINKDKTLANDLKKAKNEEENFGKDASESSDDLPRVKFVPLSAIRGDDTMRRAQNMVAGVLEILENFQLAAKSDANLAGKLGKGALAVISGTAALGEKLCKGLGAIANVNKPMISRPPDFSKGLDILFKLVGKLI